MATVFVAVTSRSSATVVPSGTATVLARKLTILNVVTGDPGMMELGTGKVSVFPAVTLGHSSTRNRWPSTVKSSRSGATAPSAAPARMNGCPMIGSPIPHRANAVLNRVKYW